jgi:hypothetical protein
MITRWIDANSPYLADMVLSSDDEARATKACEAATTALERALHRIIGLGQHDEIYHANDDGSLVLRNFPVASIDSVYPMTTNALTLSNTGATVSNASFSVVDTSTASTTIVTVRLKHTIGGTTTTTNLTSTEYPTLADLATAINSVGSGWACSVVAGWSIHPTANLLLNQYSNCRDVRGLRLWATTNSSWLVASADQGLIVGEFCRGQQVRVTYTAGFADIPEDLKQICAVVVKDMLGDSSASLQSESLGGYSYSIAQGAVARLPRNAREILASYKDRIV